MGEESPITQCICLKIQMYIKAVAEAGDSFKCHTWAILYLSLPTWRSCLAALNYLRSCSWHSKPEGMKYSSILGKKSLIGFSFKKTSGEAWQCPETRRNSWQVPPRAVQCRPCSLLLLCVNGWGLQGSQADQWPWCHPQLGHILQRIVLVPSLTFPGFL